jgi:queuine tRNA-ribosyltransferase
MNFKIIASDQHARYGQLTVNGKHIQTPAFIPTAPLNQENFLVSEELSACHIQGLTINLIDLLWRLRPEKLPNNITLATFLSWQGLLIARLGDNTDLGEHIRNLTANGLTLQSPVNGQKYALSPEKYVTTLQQMSPDFMISFHYQPNLRYTKGMSLKEEQQLLNMNAQWYHLSQKIDHPSITYVPYVSKMLQTHVIDSMQSIDTEGYAFDNKLISASQDDDVLWDLPSKLPQQKFRFITGIDTLEALASAISSGFDLIESKEPLKKAAAGQLFTSEGEINLKEQISIKDGSQPIDANCGCYTCKNFSREYLQYLCWNNIMLGQRLNAIHNIYFYQQLMLNIRQAIQQGRWQRFSLQLRDVA